MWENTDGKVAGSVFTRGGWSTDIPIVDMLPGAPIAANIDSDSTPFILRAWYRSPKGDLRQMQFDSLDQIGWNVCE
jgi:hypothetical protein